MDRFCRKITNLAKYIVLFIGGGIALYLAIYSCLFTNYLNNTWEDETVYCQKDSLIWNIVCFIVFILVGMLLANVLAKIKWLTENKLIVITCLIIGIPSIAWQLMTWLLPIADQERVYVAAERFLVGNYEDILNYFAYFPYQIGITFLYEIFLFFVGTDDGPMKIHILNSVWYMIAVFFLGKITMKLFQNKRILIYELLLTIFCFPWFFMIPLIYGDIPFLAFMFMGYYFFLQFDEKKKLMYALGMIFCIGFSYVLKPNALIFLVAIALVMILNCMNQRSGRWLLAIVSFLVVISLLMPSIKLYYEKKSGYQFSKGVPMMSYLVMGLSDTYNPGWYTGYVIKVYDKYDGDYEEMEQDTIGQLNRKADEMKNNPMQAIDFFVRKTATQWNEPSFLSWQSNECFRYDPSEFVERVYFGDINDKIFTFMNRYQFVLYALFFMSIVLFIREEANLNKYVLIIYIIGGFLFSLGWEAKGRYIYPYMVCMIPFAAYAIEQLQQTGVKLYRSYRIRKKD